jgi:hypothetical protein
VLEVQVPWSPKGILLVKEVKNVITYIAFFEIDLRLQEMGIHQVWAWSLNNQRECSAGTWWRKRQVPPQIMVLLPYGVRFSANNNFVAQPIFVNTYHLWTRSN